MPNFLEYLKKYQQPQSSMDSFGQAFLKAMQGAQDKNTEFERQKEMLQAKAESTPSTQRKIKLPEALQKIYANLHGGVPSDYAEIDVGAAGLYTAPIPTQFGYTDPKTGEFVQTTQQIRPRVATAPISAEVERKAAVEEGTRPAAIETAKQLADVDLDKQQAKAIKDQLIAFNSASTVFKKLEEQLAGLDINPGALNRITEGGVQKIGSFFQTNPKATQYEATKRGTGSAIARMYEKGVLTDEDYKRALANVPDLFDSQEVRKSKMQTLREILESTIDNLSVNLGKVPSVKSLGGKQNKNEMVIDGVKITVE